MNATPFPWDTRTEEAAQLLADGRLSLTKLAALLGIDRKTLYHWRSHEEFARRVAVLNAEFRAEVHRHGLACREARLVALNDRWQQLHAVIEARAAAPEMQEVPGGKTGLLAHDRKTIGSGASAQVVDVYRVDGGLLRSLLDLERQAAIETGQWTEKREVVGSVRKTITVSVLGPGISMDDL